jgi:hypothetical protein
VRGFVFGGGIWRPVNVIRGLADVVSLNRH